jgi:hypothetical protein
MASSPPPPLQSSSPTPSASYITHLPIAPSSPSHSSTFSRFAFSVLFLLRFMLRFYLGIRFSQIH